MGLEIIFRYAGRTELYSEKSGNQERYGRSCWFGFALAWVGELQARVAPGVSKARAKRTLVPLFSTAKFTYLCTANDEKSGSFLDAVYANFDTLRVT